MGTGWTNERVSFFAIHSISGFFAFRGAEEMSEQVYSPTHYTGGKVETIEKVLTVIEGLPAEPAYLLGQIIRYCDRCDAKHDDPMQDLAKANNYAHKLVTGEWRQ